LQKKRGFLLASFITSDNPQEIEEEVHHIVNNTELTNNLIFLLQDTENPSKKIITYNAIVEKNKPLNSRLFTMRVHRKKQTNTLYTINGLNAAVAKQHDGARGKHLKLNWEEYENCLLLTTGKELRCHSVEVTKIYKIEDEPEE
jgi:hypothetical protein